MTAKDLIALAEKGSTESLKRYLARSDPPASNALNEALRYAAIRPHPEIVGVLLGAGADPTAGGSENDQALAHAAMGGDPELVRQMIALGCDVNHQNINGRTPLIWAGWFGKLESVRILVEAGAELDHIPRTGGPAIVEAARSNHFDCVTALALLGAKVEAVEAADYYQRTPLMMAAARGAADCCAVLLRHGADIERQDRQGMRPLMHAANKGDPKTIRLLLEHGADSRKRDTKGRTALGWASPFNAEAAAILASRTGMLDESRPAGADTPLMRAATAGALETVKVYLERGARVQPLGVNGRSALTAAVALQRQQVIDYLLQLEQTNVDYPGDRNGLPSLHIAASNGDVDTLQKLIERGARPDILDREGRSALHLACRHGRTEAAAWLHAAGLAIDERDDLGRTGLLNAAELTDLWNSAADYLRLFGWLLDQGADPNAVDKAGFSPLVMMAAKAPMELLRLVVEEGGDVNHMTINGETALKRAVSVGFVDERYQRPRGRKSDNMADTIEYLLQQRADPRPGGRSLMSIAKETRCPQIVKLLRVAEAGGDQ